MTAGLPYRSPRGYYLLAAHKPSIPTIAVELASKWYYLFLVSPDGSVTALEDYEGLEAVASSMDASWCGDHVFNPHVIQAYADAHGYSVSMPSYEAMIGRWEREHLEKYP